MINENELRKGNIVGVNPESPTPYFKKSNMTITVNCINETGINGGSDGYDEVEYVDLIPITITEDILLKCGFEKVPTFTVMNSMTINVGRDRYLSIGSVGTPNEMMFLLTHDEGSKKIDDLIVLWNFDYDGKLYLHTLQNWYKLFTQQELKIEL